MSILLKGYRNVIVCSKGRFRYVLNCREQKQLSVKPDNVKKKLVYQLAVDSIKFEKKKAPSKS